MSAHRDWPYLQKITLLLSLCLLFGLLLQFSMLMLTLLMLSLGSLCLPFIRLFLKVFALSDLEKKRLFFFIRAFHRLNQAPVILRFLRKTLAYPQIYLLLGDDFKDLEQFAKRLMPQLLTAEESPEIFQTKLYGTSREILFLLPSAQSQKTTPRSDLKVILLLLQYLQLWPFGRSIRGVLLFAKAQALGEPTLPTQASPIALLLSDIGQFCGSKTPLYLLITHGEAILGFSPWQKILTPTQQQAVLGWTLSSQLPSTTTLSKAFEVYQSALELHLTQRFTRSLEPSATPEQSQKILAFRPALARTSHGAQALLHQLGFSTISRAPYQFAGLYWSLETLTDASSSADFCFVDRLWSQVIADQNRVLGEPYLPLKYQKFVRKTQAILGVSLAGIALFFLLQAFFNAENYLSQNETKLAVYAKASQALLAKNRSFLKIESTLALAQKLADFSPGNYWLLGFPAIGKLTQAKKNLYEKALWRDERPFVIATIQTQLSEALRKNTLCASQKLSCWNTIYAWLSADLMMVSPAHFEKKQIYDLIFKVTQGPSNDEAMSASSHLASLLSLMEASKTHPLLWTSASLNPALIQQARQALTPLSLPQLAYQTLQVEFQNPLQKQRTPESTAQAPEFFTLDRYLSFFAPRIPGTIEKTRARFWVFNLPDQQISNTTAQDKEALLQLYFRDYQRHFQNKLLRLLAKPPTQLSEFSQYLKSDQLQHQVWNEFLDHYQNTALERFEKNNVAAAGIAMAKTFQPINRFIQEDLPAWQKNIGELSLALVALAEDKNPPERGYQLSRDFLIPRQREIKEWAVQLKREPPAIQAWLDQILRHSIFLISSNAYRFLALKWEEQLADFCQSDLAPAYPFDETASQTVDLSVLEDLFSSHSRWMIFFDTWVNPLLQQKANGQAQVAVIAGIPIAIWPALQRNIDTLTLIHRDLFDRSGQHLAMQWNLTPLWLSKNLSAVTVQINEQTLSYEHGPLFSLQGSWPLKTQEASLSMRYTWINHTVIEHAYPGEFGWRRWLKKATIKPLSDQSYLLSFREGEAVANYQLSTSTHNLERLIKPWELVCHLATEASV